MSCDRINPRDFHGPAAADYTARCLEELAASRPFKSYVRHLDYKERLHLTWFLAPLSLVAVFYYHLAVFNPSLLLPVTDITASVLEGRAAHADGLLGVTLLVLLFILPCTLVAPFAGFFEEPSRRDSLRLLLLLTLANAAVVSCGSPLLHHPPFLTTQPAIPWLRIIPGLQAGSGSPIVVMAAEATTSGSSIAYAETVRAVAAGLRVVAVRAVPLQGFLFAGYAVSLWQRGFWRRVWHLPFPLLTVPVLVGAWGVAFWRLATLAMPYAFDSEGGLTNASRYTWAQARSDPSGVLSLWRSVLGEVAQTVRQDAVRWAAAGFPLPAALADPIACVHLYAASLGMAVCYFALLAARPFIEFLIGGLCLVLPVDPTVWGLTVASAVAGLVALLRMEGLMLPYVAAVGGLVFLLLYNGFVA